jgi:hypothetical protein
MSARVAGKAQWFAIVHSALAGGPVQIVPTSRDIVPRQQCFVDLGNTLGRPLNGIFFIGTGRPEGNIRCGRKKYSNFCLTNTIVSPARTSKKKLHTANSKKHSKSIQYVSEIRCRPLVTVDLHQSSCEERPVTHRISGSADQYARGLSVDPVSRRLWPPATARRKAGINSFRVDCRLTDSRSW